MFKQFYVLLHGKNFDLTYDDGVHTVGFWATRYIDAADAEQAAAKATSQIWRDPKIAHFLNKPTNPPRLVVDTISQMHWLACRFRRAKGYTFYRVEDE